MLWVQSVSEVNYEVVEDLRVHLLAKLHYYEPVPKPKVLHNCHDVVVVAGFGTAAENQISRMR